MRCVRLRISSITACARCGVRHLLRCSSRYIADFPQYVLTSFPCGIGGNLRRNRSSQLLSLARVVSSRCHDPQSYVAAFMTVEVQRLSLCLVLACLFLISR